MHRTTARPHQGIAQRVPKRPGVISVSPTPSRFAEPILSGLLNDYTQAGWRTNKAQLTSPNPLFGRDTFGHVIESTGKGTTPSAIL